MQKLTFLFLLFLSCASSTSSFAQKSKRVNPIIGTNGMGHTFPGACAPHGIVQLSPDTDTIPHNINGVYQPRSYEYCAGYQFKDSTIVGFSHTHFSGTGHSDLGDLLLMPFTGEVQLNPGTADFPDNGYRSRFSHNTEISQPGYYEVLLSDDQIKAQLTASKRTGIHKYSYPKNEVKKLILDLNHGIYNYDGKVLWANLRVENDTLITGYRITNGWSRVNYTYFAISFSEPIQNYGYTDHAQIKYPGGFRRFAVNKNFPEIGGRQIVSFFEFSSDTDSPLEVKVALSAVGTDGALKNLQAEAGGKDFEAIRKETCNDWENALSVIDAEGSDDQLSMLYTSLYHTMINPSVYMDVDGKYRGLDHNIHQSSDFTNYTVFSLWDTYRALHPLFNIINRKVSADIIQSMLAHYQQSVHKILPVWSHMGNENWCMIGYHGVSVLADAIIKGIPVDKELALEAMISSANLPYYDHTEAYKQYGYVPFDNSPNAASVTLENAYEDWTIYQTASLMQQKEVEETYKKRASSFENIFKPGLGFASPRYADGTWKKDLDLLSTHGQGFIEGNSWNYSFYVPQDPSRLIALMGGNNSFVNKMDSLFTMHLPDEFFAHTEDVTREGLLGSYVHGNEPSHHIPYLYAWTDKPWKSQYWIREIMNKMYRNNIDGLCGNDDCGQMSAWYIFSAMGFYPVCPGTNQYVIGAPYLPYVKINLDNGKTFEVQAKGVSDKKRYIKSVKLNGKPYPKAYITHEDIMNGGLLEFEMTSQPQKKRVYSDQDKPYSLSQETAKL